jgi:hypothetical protein
MVIMMLMISEWTTAEWTTAEWTTAEWILPVIGEF